MSEPHITTVQDLEVFHVTDSLTHGYTVYRLEADAVSGVLTVAPFRPGSNLDVAEGVYVIDVASGMPDLLDNRFLPDADREDRLTIDGYTITGSALLHIRPGQTATADLMDAANDQQAPAAPNLFGEIAAALALAWLTGRSRADVRYAAYAPATRTTLRAWRRAAEQATAEAERARAYADGLTAQVIQAAHRLDQLQTDRETG